MGGIKIKCLDCVHFDNINLCKTRAQFVKSSKGRYCQDFVDKTKILKPKEEILQPVKPLEEVPVEAKPELEPKVILPKVEIKLKWWQRILKFLVVFFKGRQ